MGLPGGSIKLFSVWGIRIEAHVTWFPILFFVAYLLAGRYFPSVYVGLSAGVYVALGLATALLVFASVLLHELAHSAVAQRRGLTVSRITLFIFGGAAQMQQEPVRPRDELAIAAAGPVTSIGLALFFGALWFSAGQSPAARLMVAPAEYLFLVNGVLAVFNLVPGFPLDGGRVLRAIIWGWTGRLRLATAVAARSGQAVAYLLIFLGFFAMLSGAFVNGLWFVLIGWFLEQAALGSYEAMRFETALRDIAVGDIMTERVRTIDPGSSLRELVDEHVLVHRFGRFPVVDGDGLVGVISMREVRVVPQPLWGETTVAEAMLPLSDHVVIGPRAMVTEAMLKMARGEVGQLLVVDDGALVGLLTRADVVRIVNIREDLDI